MARRFSDADLQKIIAAFRSSADAVKAVREVVSCDPVTARRYVAMLTLIERYEIAGEVTNDLWAKVMQDDGFTPLLEVGSARAMVGRLARLRRTAGDNKHSPRSSGTEAGAYESDARTGAREEGSGGVVGTTLALVERQAVVGMARELADLLDMSTPAHGMIRPIWPETLQDLAGLEARGMDLRGPTQPLAAQSPTHAWTGKPSTEALRRRFKDAAFWQLVDQTWPAQRAAFADCFGRWLARLVSDAQAATGLPLVVPRGRSENGDKIRPTAHGILPGFVDTVTELGTRPHLRRLGLNDAPDSNAVLGYKAPWGQAKVPLRFVRLASARGLPMDGPWSYIPSQEWGIPTSGDDVRTADLVFCGEDQWPSVRDAHNSLVGRYRQDPETDRLCLLWAADRVMLIDCMQRLRSITVSDLV